MFSLFKKFKDGLTKTVSAIAAKTHGLFGGRKIDATSLAELEEALYTADFGVETTTEILEEIKTAYRKDADLKGQQAATIGAAVLRRVLAGSEGKLPGAAATSPRAADHGGVAVAPMNPTVICMIGVNGGHQQSHRPVRASPRLQLADRLDRPSQPTDRPTTIQWILVVGQSGLDRPELHWHAAHAGRGVTKGTPFPGGSELA